MEDKRTAVALLLCIIVIMLYSEYFINPLMRPAQLTQQSDNSVAQQNVQQPQQQVNAPTQNNLQQGNPQQFNVAAPTTAKNPSAAELADAGLINIESNSVSISISNLGARLTKYKLKNYKLHKGSDELVDMVSSVDGGPAPLAVYVGTSMSDSSVRYALSGVNGGTQNAQGTIEVPAGGELTLNFSGTLPNGITIQKIFKLRPDSYMFDVNVHLSAPSSDGASVWLEWSHFLSDPDLHARLNAHQYTLLSASSNKISHTLLPDLYTEMSRSGAARELGDNQWVSFANIYFMATLIPEQKGPNFRAALDGNSFLTRAIGNANGGNFSVYLGPKDYRILQGLGFELQRNIDLGWFSFLAFPLISVIRFFEQVFGNYGLAIILLTLLIKTLFLPLTRASFESMRAMQEIQPEVKALRDRIKDATQLNQEMMALYKRKGVNPMGGCLPMLIQLPVFLGLYNALLNSIELRHAPFALWINDLSSPEALMIGGVPVPVMVLLMGASMFFQQLTSPSPSADPAQRKIMMMMPVVFTVMFVIFPFPAGLVLYWLVNNVISITQQVYLRSHRKASPLVATVIASLCIFCFGFVLTLVSK